MRRSRWIIERIGYGLMRVTVRGPRHVKPAAYGTADITAEAARYRKMLALAIWNARHAERQFRRLTIAPNPL